MILIVFAIISNISSGTLRMMLVEWEQVGLIAGILTMFGFVPQILKIYRTESVADVSLAMLVQYTVGIFLWLLYGVHLHDRNLIISNAVSFFTLVVAVGLYLRYCRRSFWRRIARK